MTCLLRYRGRGFDSRRFHHLKKMKDYLIWYRLKSDREDRIRGMARNWPRAEKMAEKLYFSLRIDKKSVIQTGVKRLYHGQLYNDHECSLRWVVCPPELIKEK
jgi:hypothetical protein